MSSYSQCPDGRCGHGLFSCAAPHQQLYLVAGLLAAAVLAAKAAVNLKCLVFSAGVPGIGGRSFLLYADQLQVEIDANSLTPEYFIIH